MTDRPNEQLRQSEERFRKIFEHSNDAIFLLDAEADAIVDANERACHLLGYAHGELLRVAPSVIHQHEIERFRAFSRSVLDRGSGWTAELSCRCKSGRIVPAEISGSVVEIGGERRMLAIVRDVSERHRLQEELRRHAERLEGLVEEQTARLRRSEERQRVLLQINNAIVSNRDGEELFRAVAEVLRSLLSFDRASLVLGDRTRGVLTLHAFADREPPRVLPSIGTEIPIEQSRIRWVLERGEPLLLPDLRQEPVGSLERRMADERGLRCAIMAPLITKGRVLGTLNVGSRNVDQYSEDDAAFLGEIAKQVALAVDNVLAFDEIRRLKARLEQENLYLQEEARSERGLDGIVGESRAIQRVKEAVATVAPTDTGVLITGETGTGKELVARALHVGSPRRGKALVKVNCAALPAGLIESELFGHEKGAFTGALSRKVGRFELADGGTIFLDEIGDLPLELQAKLLRVLQEGEFERVGGTQTLKVKVRVIAATNQDLEKAVECGKFRVDLYYRLNVFPIAVPPLRDRKEDIPILVRHVVMRNAAKLGKRIETIPDAATEALVAYAWPGNVRELENIVERAVILSRGRELELFDSLPVMVPTLPSASRVQSLSELERGYILDVLRATSGRVSGPRGAARLLGLKPTTLEARIRKLGIQKPR